MAAHVAAMVGFQDAGAEVFDYGNSIRGEAELAGYERAFAFPGFVPAYIRPLFCEGRGPFRWAALSGDPADIAATDDAILDLFPQNEALARWIRMAQEKVHFQGLPARICWLGYGERHLAGQRFNELVRRGDVSAPIVLGRDHLDCGSVASPYRETEAMADGSDAIADWPLLNALVNTASGASWVSIHHGGGVGIGRSIHAGQVCVADGTELAGQKLERVLTNDPGMGVIRHADAGYDRATEVAAERGVRVPMATDAASHGLHGPVGRAGARSGRTPRTGGYRRYSWTPADLACRDWFAATAPTSGCAASATATATCGRGGHRREPTARPSPPAATWTRYPTAAPSTGRSASCPRSPRSTCCASGASPRPGRWRSPRSPRRKAPGSAWPAWAAGCSTGAIDPDAARGAARRRRRQPGRRDGRRRARPGRARPRRRACWPASAAYVELHIEQGSALAGLGAPVGVADGDLAARPLAVRLHRPRRPRRDDPDRRPPRPDAARTRTTVLAARESAAAARRAGHVRARSSPSRAAPTRSARAVRAWLDARAPDEETLAALRRRDQLRPRRSAAAGARASARRAPGVVHPAGEFDAGAAGPAGRRPRRARGMRGPPVLPTGAGHDAGMLAARLPTAMLFVRNPTGVSHSPPSTPSRPTAPPASTALAAVLATWLP